MSRPALKAMHISNTQIQDLYLSWIDPHMPRNIYGAFCFMKNDKYFFFVDPKLVALPFR